MPRPRHCLSLSPPRPLTTADPTAFCTRTHQMAEGSANADNTSILVETLPGTPAEVGQLRLISCAESRLRDILTDSHTSRVSCNILVALPPPPRFLPASRIHPTTPWQHVEINVSFYSHPPCVHALCTDSSAVRDVLPGSCRRFLHHGERNFAY